MLTKTEFALAAVLLAGTASIASAQEFDPNLANPISATVGFPVRFRWVVGFITPHCRPSHPRCFEPEN